MKTIAVLLATVVIATQSFGQEQDSQPSPLTVSGYVEAYYAYDFNKPENNTRPGFLYSHNRHNEINLNLGFIRAAYTTDKVRANLGLMAGTYTNANLANEPGVLKNVWEANTGVKLSAIKNLWVDAGIFSSHIGFESAMGKDCWTLTRSLQAEMSPYYEAGARVSYTTDTEKWFLSVLVLNGWQHIQRQEGNSLPAFGTQVTFKPSDAITINSSTFFGSDKPDSVRQMRYFHNLYGIFQINKTIGITAGFDIGLEEEHANTNNVQPWLSPLLIARFTMSDKIALAVRGEYYRDKHNIIVATEAPNGFETTGLSVNFDYKISDNALWRVEYRTLRSRDAIFPDDNGAYSKDNTALTTALAISF